MTQQIAANRRVNRRCNRGQALAAKPGDRLWRLYAGRRLAAILKPSGRVRVLGVVQVAARCWRRCAVPLAGCGAGKEKPGAVAGLGGAGGVAAAIDRALASRH